MCSYISALTLGSADSFPHRSSSLQCRVKLDQTGCIWLTSDLGHEQKLQLVHWSNLYITESLWNKLSHHENIQSHFKTGNLQCVITQHVLCNDNESTWPDGRNVPFFCILHTYTSVFVTSCLCCTLYYLPSSLYDDSELMYYNEEKHTSLQFIPQHDY